MTSGIKAAAVFADQKVAAPRSVIPSPDSFGTRDLLF